MPASEKILPVQNESLAEDSFTPRKAVTPPPSAPRTSPPGRSRLALSGITNQSPHPEPDRNCISPLSPPAPPLRPSTDLSLFQTTHSIELHFDPSPGPFVRLKRLSHDGHTELVVARDLDYDWCRGKHPARILCLKIYSKKGVIEEDNEDLVIKEVLAYKRLSHKDAIVGTAFVSQLDAILEDDRHIFLVMDPMERDLADVLAGPHSERTQYKKRWAAQIVLGLSAIHASGIIHRDIKPSALLIDYNNNIRIAGFGSAFIKGHCRSYRPRCDTGDEQTSGNRRSTTSSILPVLPNTKYSSEIWGTWPYTAPEILANVGHFSMDWRPYTLAVDYWALGCIIYELETGRPLFRMLGDVTVYGRYPMGMYPAFHELNREAETLVFGLTRSDVSHRFGDSDLRKHGYFKDDHEGSEFKKWTKGKVSSRSRPRPRTPAHIEADTHTSKQAIYKPSLDWDGTDPSNLWSFREHCWINPRGLWGSTSKSYILYET